MKQWIGLIMCVGLFSGCTMSFNYNFWSQKAPATPSPVVSEIKMITPSQVLMYELDITDRPYTTLGEVSASVTKLNPWGADPKQSEVETKLREEAVKKGADALIYVRYTKVGVSYNRWNGIDGKAQAVKFKHY